MSSARLVLEVDHLSKRYVIGGARNFDKSFREMIMGALSAPIRRYKNLSGQVKDSEQFFALHDVSFSINQGDVVGIIGKNGAGKSTLLKILSRITTPTAGQVTIRGNVASLLEVGTGFHPELTGRENIYLNGAILGMKRKEIKQKFDGIVEFANIEKFVDTPVKRYSSGMYVRLAFSVAAHLDPDILIVDEVLAVGDIEFQNRCLGKLNDIAVSGRTVLFVSHNINSINSLCNSAIWLDRGEVKKIGATSDVVNSYVSDSITGYDEVIESNIESPIKLKRIYVCDSQANKLTHINYSQLVYVKVFYETVLEPKNYSIAIQLIDSSDNIVFTSWDIDSLKASTRYNEVIAVLPGNMFKPGQYRIKVLGLDLPYKRPKICAEAMIKIEITNNGYTFNPRREGVIAPLLDWQTQK